METSDYELVYLYRTESLQIALVILYNRYFESLISATCAYYLHKFNRVLGLEVNDIKSLCFQNFIKIINEFDLNIDKYSFRQYVFIANRSHFRDYLIRHLKTLGNYVLNNTYWFSEINGTFINLVQSDDSEQKIVLRLLVDEILDYAKFCAIRILNNKQLNVFNLWINGCDFDKIHKQTSINFRKLPNIVRGISKRINFVIAYKFNLNFTSLPYNFCLLIQGM